MSFKVKTLLSKTQQIMRLNQAEDSMVIKYDGSNYAEWKAMMTALLLEKELYSILLEEKPKPWNDLKTTEEEKLELITYMSKSNKAKGKLCMFMESSYMMELITLETAKEIWDTIAKWNDNTTAESLQMLRDKFYSSECNMAEKENVVDHLIKLRNIQTQTKGSQAPIVDQELVTRIFNSLPSSWRSYVDGIRGANPNIKYEELLIKLKAYGNQRLSEERESTGNLAFNSIKKGQQKKKQKCSNCHKPGHSKENCWAKGGDKEGQRPKRYGKYAQKMYGLYTASKAIVNTSELQKEDWILDSGANSHFTNDKSLLFDFQETQPEEIQVAKGEALMHAVGIGKIKLRPSHLQNTIVELHKVLYVPDLSTNLLSLSQVDQKGFTYHGGNNELRILGPERETILIAKMVNSTELYLLDAQPIKPKYQAFPTQKQLGKSTQATLGEWHRRLGHLNTNSILRLAKEGSIQNLNITSTNANFSCLPCQLGKQKAYSFQSDTNANKRAKDLLELVHSDVASFPVSTKEGYHHYVSFLDDFSNCLVIALMRKKSEVLEHFKQYKLLVEKITGKQLKALKCDNGGEYTSKAFKSFCRQEGIQVNYSTPYTPEQNGKAERLNQTIAGMIRAMLQDSGLPKNYWGYAATMAVFIRNRSPHPLRNEKCTPIELFKGIKPDASFFQPFGATATAKIPEQFRKKLDPKAVKVIILGMNENGYIVENTSTGSIFRSRNVQLYSNETMPSQTQDETPRNFLGANQNSSIFRNPIIIKQHNLLTNQSEDDVSHGPIISQQYDLSSNQSEVNVSDEPIISQQYNLSTNQSEDELLNDPIKSKPRESTTNNWDFNILNPSLGQATSEIQGQQESTPRNGNSYNLRSRSATNLPNISKFSESDAEDNDGDLGGYGPCSPITPCKTPVRKTQKHVHTALSACLQEDSTPKTFSDAIASPEHDKWRKSMQEEFNSLLLNQTWDVVNLPANRKAIHTRWVYRIKKNEAGHITKYKSRLVAKGFSQKYGIDYFETFSPVAKATTFRLLIALSTVLTLTCLQTDISTAFLNGTVEEDIFINLPEGFENETLEAASIQKGTFCNPVCKLKKSLYGIKQAPRNWNMEIKSWLTITMQLQQSKFDPCLFIQKNSNEEWDLLVLIYVDDIIAAGKSRGCAQTFMDALTTKYKASEVQDLNWMLGMKVEQDLNKGISKISQKQLIQDKVQLFGLQQSKPVSTPLTPNFNNYDIQPSQKLEPFREIIGGLMYLATTTRPDIMFAVSLLSRYLDCYSTSQFAEAKRVLNYLKCTQDFALTFQKSKGLNPQIYVDADFNSDPVTRKSVSGYAITIAGAAISYQSKKQKTTALSSMEAEYIAVAELVQEVLWLSGLYQELGIQLSTPILINEDNQSCIAYSKNDVNHGRAKHIDIKYHFVKDLIKEGKIKLQYIESNDNIADIFTKALSKPSFEKHRKGLGLLTNLRLRGSIEDTETCS